LKTTGEPRGFGRHSSAARQKGPSWKRGKKKVCSLIGVVSGKVTRRILVLSASCGTAGGLVVYGLV